MELWLSKCLGVSDTGSITLDVNGLVEVCYVRIYVCVYGQSDT